MHEGSNAIENYARIDYPNGGLAPQGATPNRTVVGLIDLASKLANESTEVSHQLMALADHVGGTMPAAGADPVSKGAPISPSVADHLEEALRGLGVALGRIQAAHHRLSGTIG